MENQDTISAWAIETFGYPKSGKKIVERFVEEVIELDTKSAAALPKIDELRDECADCLIVLFQVANTYGFSLLRAVDEKMKINRERVWKTDGDGVGQHVD